MDWDHYKYICPIYMNVGVQTNPELIDKLTIIDIVNGIYSLLWVLMTCLVSFYIIREISILRKDIKEKDIKEKDIKEKDIKEKDIKEKDIKEKDIKEKDIKEKPCSIDTQDGMSSSNIGGDSLTVI
jgi:predicted membrane protein